MQVKILLLTTSLLLASCLSMKEAPIDYFYVIDIPHGVCTQKQVLDRQTLTMKTVAELPLIECDGNIGMRAQEFLNLRTWIRNGGKK